MSWSTCVDDALVEDRLHSGQASKEDPGQMANELRRSDNPPDIPAGGSGNQASQNATESDPCTWYGLVWRIVRIAMESNANLIRVSILVILACAVLWVLVGIGR
jgi:hypothetical protein